MLVCDQLGPLSQFGFFLPLFGDFFGTLFGHFSDEGGKVCDQLGPVPCWLCLDRLSPSSPPPLASVPANNPPILLGWPSSI